MSEKKNVQPQQQTEIPKEYKPISVWGYFGYEILFTIPVVGLIFMILCSLSKNKNLKNFALSHFCLLLIFVVIIIIALSLGLGAMLSEIAGEYFGIYF